MSTRNRIDAATGRETEVERTRTEVAIEWAVWHFGELAGVLGPLALAGLFTAWFVLVSAAVGVCWVAHEVRLSRRQAAIGGKSDPARITTRDTESADVETGESSEEASA